MTQWWLVPGLNMRQVDQFFGSHHMNGLQSPSGVADATRQGVEVESMTSRPDTGSDLAALTAGQIYVQWTATPKGVAVQVYARVTWRPTRNDPTGLLPADVTSVKIVVTPAGGKATITRTVSGGVARDLAVQVNSLPVLEAEPLHSCLPSRASDQLTFAARGRTFDVAVQSIDDNPGCDEVALDFGSQRSLEGGYRIHDQIVASLALPKSYAGESPTS